MKDNVQDNCISIGKLLGDMYGWIDEELQKIDSCMLKKKLNSEKLELFDDSKLNGIVVSFRYTSMKKAVIGDIDVAQCMLSMLKKQSQRGSNPQWGDEGTQRDDNASRCSEPGRLKHSKPWLLWRVEKERLPIALQHKPQGMHDRD